MNRSRLALGAVALAIVALAIVPALVAARGAGTSAPEAPCAVANRWVEAHLAMLPSNLAELSRYPMLYRRSAFAHAAPELRRALWREHLTSFLGPKSTLTARQQQTVLHTIARLPAYFSAEPSASSDQARADGLTPLRLRAQFGDSLAKAIFATLGSDDLVERSLNTNRDRIRAAASPLSRERITKPAAAGSQNPQCSCAINSNWCSDSAPSCEGGGCNGTYSGCGTLWSHGCSGMCYGNQT